VHADLRVVGSAGEGSPVGGASGDGSCRRSVDDHEGGGGSDLAENTEAAA
jgi:hypothetical protein